MSLTKRGATALAALVLAASTAVAACGGGSGSQASGGSGSTPAGGAYDVSSKTITFIPKQLNNPFSDVMLGGGKDAAAELGFA